jgi:hypothetical protein
MNWNWRCGSSGRAPALQAHAEFKPKFHKKKKKKKKEAKAGRSKVPDKPGLHSKILAQKNQSISIF